MTAAPVTAPPPLLGPLDGPVAVADRERKRAVARAHAMGLTPALTRIIGSEAFIEGYTTAMIARGYDTAPYPLVRAYVEVSS